MGKSIYNPLTGCKRRQPTKYTYKRRKDSSLDAGKQRFLSELQAETEECVITSIDCLELFASIHLTRNLHIAAFGEHTPYTDALLDVLDSVHQHAFSTYCYFECLQMVDVAIGVMPHEEANARCFQRPNRFQRTYKRVFE